MTPEGARAFIRELWRVLPPFRGVTGQEEERNDTGDGKREEDEEPEVVRGKMIISRRSHYFKDVWSQNSMLTSEGRDGIRADDYRACILLPFNDEQVRQYLEKALGADRVEAVVDLMQSVHNLSELAERPYLLSVIVEHIEELERRRASGEPVAGVTLYEIAVRQWLGRDDGKHHFTHAHTEILMEELAAAMWVEGEREWKWKRLEGWLDTFLHEHPSLADRYRGTDPEILNEDLRTATFILRPDDSQEHFRFAHTSLLEYFLARYLLRALAEGNLPAWGKGKPSQETLDFVGQLMLMEGDDRHVESLNLLLATYQPPATKTALRYWILAAREGYPMPTPAQIDLQGSDLTGWEIAGRDAERCLELPAVNLENATLYRTSFRNGNMANADLRNVFAPQAEFLAVDASGVCAEGADLNGTIWRDVDARGLRMPAGSSRGSEWIRTKLSGAILPDPPPAHPSTAVVSLRSGHSNGVLGCAWSPDGQRVLSASSDNSLRIWDEDSGETVYSIEMRSPDEAAAIDWKNNQVLWASPEAWRFIAWRETDSETGEIRMHPAEVFGPLPG